MLFHNFFQLIVESLNIANISFNKDILILLIFTIKQNLKLQQINIALSPLIKFDNRYKLLQKMPEIKSFIFQQQFRIGRELEEKKTLDVVK